MRLPRSFTTVTPFSKLLAGLLFISLPFAGFFLGVSYQSKIDQSKIANYSIVPHAQTNNRSGNIQKISSAPFQIPSYYGHILVASSDAKISLRPEFETTMTIPKGTRYNVDEQGWSIGVDLTSNVRVFMCFGCQPLSFYAKCGPSYGMSGEGNCSKKKSTIDAFAVTEYIYNEKPYNIAFYALEDSAIDFFAITTTNEQQLTSEEEAHVSNFLGNVLVKGKHFTKQ